MFKKASVTSARSGGVAGSSAVKKDVLPNDPKTWTEEQVGKWLDNNGFGKYRKNFQDQSIAGNELLDLTENELASLKLNPSERAKCLMLIQGIRRRHAEGGDIDKGDDESSSSTGSGSGTSKSSEVSVKCYFGEDVRRCSVKPDISLHDLKRRVKRLYSQKMSLKYRDSDGDLINLRTNEDWTHCVKRFGNGDVKLEVKPYERSMLHRNEAQVLEAMVDGVIMIDAQGKIYFINRAGEKLTGYTKEDLMGKNVNILMGSDDASRHDGYLAHYLATGEAKIIGKGRAVQMKRKDGQMIPAELSVSHTKSRSRDVFTGILRPTSSNPGGSGGGVTQMFQHIFSVLQNLPQGSVATNEDGIIQFVNTKAVEMLGYKSSADLIGQNVKMIMPEPHHSNHDNYLRNYIRTGQAKIIGRPRDLIAMCKDGSLLPIKLAISEQWVGSTRIFTATIFRLEDIQSSTGVASGGARVEAKSVLQQERESVSHLAIPAVVIDSKGTIQGFNAAAEKIWGFSVTEVAGRNVKMLMSFADAERHDSHLQRYLTSGKTKVIGVGRQVVAQKKNGDMFPMHLAVSERIDADKRIWTGVCQPI